MNPIHVKVITPKGIAYEGDALSVYVPATKGVIGVLPGHTPFIADLAEEGVLRIQDTMQRESRFLIRGGALEIKPEETIILTGHSEPLKDQA